MVIGSGDWETTQGKDQDKENFIPLSSLADLTGWVVAPLIYASMAGRPTISEFPAEKAEHMAASVCGKNIRGENLTWTRLKFFLRQ